MHNFKKVLKTFLVLVVCVALLAALDLALYPCTFMRNDVHAVVTQQFDDIIVGTSHGKMDIDPEPCQCFTSAGILMQSPGFISTASLPST